MTPGAVVWEILPHNPRYHCCEIQEGKEHTQLTEIPLLTALVFLLFSQLIKLSPTEISGSLLLLPLSQIIGLASRNNAGGLEKTLDHPAPQSTEVQTIGLSFV